jgi:hypothetical protein
MRYLINYEIVCSNAVIFLSLRAFVAITMHAKKNPNMASAIIYI